MKLKPQTIITTSTVIGTLAGSYSAFLASKKRPTMTFIEAELWGFVGGVAGRVIGFALSNHKGKKLWK
jgi:hypothetical protein